MGKIKQIPVTNNKQIKISPENNDEICFENLFVSSDRLNSVKKLEFFIDKFLPKNAIVCFYANQGAGKSIFMIGLCQMILKNFDDIAIMYFDAENSLEILKSRGVNFLISDFKGRFNLLTSENEKGQTLCHPREFLQIFSTKSQNLSNTIIILDSFRDFYPRGFDMNQDKSIDLVFDYLKTLRNQGASIILLHHTTKNKQDENGIIIPKGSGAIADNCDYLIQAKRVELENKAIMLFEVSHYGKARGGFQERAYEIPQTSDEMLLKFQNDQMLLTECDFRDVCTLDDENNALLKEALFEILSLNANGLKQCELRKNLKNKTKLGDNAIYQFIAKYAQYFCNIKLSDKNAKIYKLKNL